MLTEAGIIRQHSWQRCPGVTKALRPITAYTRGNVHKKQDKDSHEYTTANTDIRSQAEGSRSNTLDTEERTSPPARTEQNMDRSAILLLIIIVANNKVKSNVK